MLNDVKFKICLLLLSVGFAACRNTSTQKVEQEISATITTVDGDSLSNDVEYSTVINDTTSLQEFEQAKWKSKKKNDYPYRENLYMKILYNKPFRLLQKAQVLSLLGPPDRVDSLYLFYLISQKRLGNFPLSTKTLVIKMGDDGKVERVLVHE